MNACGSGFAGQPLHITVTAGGASGSILHRASGLAQRPATKGVGKDLGERLALQLKIGTCIPHRRGHARMPEQC